MGHLSRREQFGRDGGARVRRIFELQITSEGFILGGLHSGRRVGHPILRLRLDLHFLVKNIIIVEQPGEHTGTWNEADIIHMMRREGQNKSRKIMRSVHECMVAAMHVAMQVAKRRGTMAWIESKK